MRYGERSAARWRRAATKTDRRSIAAGCVVWCRLRASTVAGVSSVVGADPVS
jgi:hypothetical protein